MFLIIFVLFLFNNNIIEGYKINIPKKTAFRLNANTPPDIWIELSNTFKKSARDWFINRAEKSGIEWKNMVRENKQSMIALKEMYNNVNDNSIVYPEYYTQAFHGYDSGNLNWDAALEGEAATLSMAVNYWKGIDPIVTEQWLRYNVTNNIVNYVEKYNLIPCNKILDVGCSVGISTEYLYNSFKNTESVTGIDLSPYFISMAKYRADHLNLPITYLHKNAENTCLKSDTYNLIVCNFILHEVPKEPTKIILNEMKRLLKPGGVLAIVDLNPDRVQNNLIVSTFRKWAFEVTEPHIYEYYKSNMTRWLKDIGLENVEKVKNDPINSIWLGTK